MKVQNSKKYSLLSLFKSLRVIIATAVVAVIGFLADITDFLDFKSNIWILILIVLVVVLFVVLLKLLSGYNELVLRLNKISTLTTRLGRLIGYKRKLLSWELVINNDGSIEETRELTIYTFQSFSEIVLSKLGGYKNIQKERNDEKFIESTGGDYTGTVTPSVDPDGVGRLIYSLKFEPVLPKESTFKIRMKSQLHPKGALMPEEHYKKLRSDGGQMFNYQAIIPVDKIKIRLKLPKGKYKTCGPLKGRYLAVMLIDSEDFLFDKMEKLEKNLIKNKSDGSPTDNIFEIEIEHPVFGLQYSICWKEY